MSEIEKRIEECISEIKPYRYSSSEAESGIKELRRLKERLRNLSEENLEELIEEVTDGYRRSLAYQSYVPRTVSNLKYIKEWLEKQREEGQK